MLCGRFFKPSIGNVPKHLNGFLLCTAILFHSSCFWVRLIKAFIIEGTSKSSVDIIIVLQFIKDLYEAFKLVRRALSKRSYFMMTHINVLRSPWGRLFHCLCQVRILLFFLLWVLEQRKMKDKDERGKKLENPKINCSENFDPVSFRLE